jgi:hypothetical protein
MNNKYNNEENNDNNQQEIGAIFKINFNLVQNSIRGNKFKTREEFEN